MPSPLKRRLDRAAEAMDAVLGRQWADQLEQLPPEELIDGLLESLQGTTSLNDFRARWPRFAEDTDEELQQRLLRRAPELIAFLRQRSTHLVRRRRLARR